MTITMLEYPTEKDWMEVKRRALVTIGKTPVTPPDDEWKRKILEARHSPIRYLRFSFLLEGLPYWVSVHLCRHVHAQPYVRSQRNDRQSDYDRNAARQDAPVSMIWDMNAEELITVVQKRLCRQAAEETREVAEEIRRLVLEQCQEFKAVLVKPCEFNGVCHEMHPCWQ
jgi:thymidylate synthase ThyX